MLCLVKASWTTWYTLKTNPIFEIVLLIIGTLLSIFNCITYTLIIIGLLLVLISIISMVDCLILPRDPLFIDETHKLSIKN